MRQRFGSHPNPLPLRYQDEEWQRPFRAAVQEVLTTGCRVLDIGAGRRPTVPAAERPPGCTYVGLDVSPSELAQAPKGAYDETITGDVTVHRAELERCFDIVLCWQVLEHVKPLADALENIRSYLVPSGRFVGQLSGAFSPFGLVNRAVPHGLAVAVLQRLLQRDPDTVFPAYYDKCWYSALMRLGEPWNSFHIEPRYAGATYFAFAAPLQRMYLHYEEWTIRDAHPNLATHYLLVGER
jgi:SAM-dependent methyltransferase